jgi:hypothetical protein
LYFFEEVRIVAEATLIPSLFKSISILFSESIFTNEICINPLLSVEAEIDTAEAFHYKYT